MPFTRLNRLRAHPALREMVRENQVRPWDLIYPMFIVAGTGVRREIPSMPGQVNLSLDTFAEEIRHVADAGVRAVMLFGVPRAKDDAGSGAFADDGIVQRALEVAGRATPELALIADTCLCEYTDNGHCLIFRDERPDLTATLDTLARTAVSQARAGADMVAPSTMVDGMVAAIRQGLDGAGFADTPIMAYSVKHASAFYGPFRQAVDSAPAFGDRSAHQMDPANGREALREAEEDAREGADILMVKPGMPCLDILARMRDRFHHPLAVYQVSGEYAMIKAAARNGWIDEDRVVHETLTAFKRAGADMILSYFTYDLIKRGRVE